MQAHLEKLRSSAEECARVRDLAVDQDERRLFAMLTGYLNLLVLEVERVIAVKRAGGLAAGNSGALAAMNVLYGPPRRSSIITRLNAASTPSTKAGDGA